MTLESDSDDFSADTEKDLHVTEDDPHNLISGELIGPSKSHENENVTPESNPKTEEAESETRLPCEAGKIAFTEISAPIVQGTLVKPQYNFISKNDITKITNSNLKAVNEKTPEKLNKSKAHRLSTKRFRASNALSITQTFTDQSPLESSEKALAIEEGTEKPQSEKCPENILSHEKIINGTLPQIISKEKAFAGDKNDQNSLSVKKTLSEIEKISYERDEKNYLCAIKELATMQKHSLSNDESSEALGGLPAREMNDVTTNKADIKLKKSKVKLNAKRSIFSSKPFPFEKIELKPTNSKPSEGPQINAPEILKTKISSSIREKHFCLQAPSSMANTGNKEVIFALANKILGHFEKSFTKKEKRKSPTQNPIGGHQESHPTTDATKEVTPVRSAEVTKATRLESIGGTKHSSNLQTVTSVEENQESKPSTDSRQKTRKQRNFTKTPTPLDEAETSSSKEIKSSSEALQGVSLPLVKSESPVARKSNFSTQKKLEKSNATFVCTLCDCNFKLKGDVMIHCIMRHHCEAPESSLLPVKTKKSSMGSGKNLLDAALKTNEGYVECENRGAKMGDLPVKKLKQKKVVTLQQYKENKTLFNSKYDSDSSGSSTSQETFKSNSFKTGTTQGKAKKVLTLQQYKAMKSSKLKFSCDNDYSSSPTGTIVGLEENLNQSALQDTKIATFSDEPDSEKDCMQRDSPSYCEVCGLQIDNSSSRAHHMEFVHPGFALKCFVCGTSCGNFDSLIKHQRRHSEFQILIGENQFLKTRKSGPNQSYPYYCTFCGTGFTLVKMFLAHKLSLQCRKKKTGELARNDVAGERDGGGKNDVAGIPEEVEKSNVPNILNEVEKDNIAGDLDEVEEDDLSDDPQLKIDEEAGETDADSEQKTIADAAEAGASSSHRNHHT